MRVEAFIFGRYKRILDVLRNLVDGNGDSFGVVVDFIKAYQLSVGIVCIDIGIIFHFQFLDGDIGNFISETHNIDGHARCHNRSGDDTNQEQGNQSGAENRERFSEFWKPFWFFRLKGIIIIRIFWRSRRGLIAKGCIRFALIDDPFSGVWRWRGWRNGFLCRQVCSCRSGSWFCRRLGNGTFCGCICCRFFGSRFSILRTSWSGSSWLFCRGFSVRSSRWTAAG